MTVVGIRELRQRASELIRLVEAGESVEVTDRGRPVAMLVPIPDDESPMERLRRQGDVIPATIFDDFDEPLPSSGGEPASVIVERLRAERSPEW